MRPRAGRIVKFAAHSLSLAILSQRCFGSGGLAAAVFQQSGLATSGFAYRCCGQQSRP